MGWKTKIRRLNPMVSYNQLYQKGGYCLAIPSFQKKEMIPDFLVMGGQKCGTGSLYGNLMCHQDVFMASPIKEPGLYLELEETLKYFNNRKDRGVKSKDDLMKNFVLQGYTGQKIFGEASTYYTIADRRIEQNIPQRIYDSNPNMKFVYMVRNPFARMVSNFLHVRRKLYGDMDFNKFIEENSADFGPVTTSHYMTQMKSYLELFPMENFKVLVFEDFLKDIQGHMNEVFSFLGLSSHDFQNDFGARNLTSNREDFEEKELKLSRENYDSVIETLEADKAGLEKFMGQSLDWDMSFQKWGLVE